MAVMNSRQFGLDFLKALGIDSKGVRSFSVDVEANSAPIVTVKRYILKEETSLDDVAMRYAAVRVEETERYRIEEKI